MTVLNIALVGCGGFVRHTHFANLTTSPGLRLYATADVNLNAARAMAQNAGAEYATDDVDRIFNDASVDAVFIATPHNTHADLTIRAAQAGKHIYCEKPMALNEADCLAVKAAVETAGVAYICGYNRCMAPFTRQARELLAGLNAPILLHHRFADWNPYGTGWFLNERLSGGRVLGEGGHSMDMMCYLMGQDPARVYAEGGNFAAPSATNAPDSALITLGFPDGSAGVLMLSSIASSGYPKEEILITCANHTIAIFGFERMLVYGPDGSKEYQLPASDKGHRDLLQALTHVISGEIESPVGVREGLRAYYATAGAVRAIQTGAAQAL